MGSVMGLHTSTLRAQVTRTTGSGAPPKGRGAGRAGAPNPRCHSEREGSPSGNFLPSPRHATPSRARKPKGRCRAPKPAHLHPQHVGSGPQLLAQSTGSRERVSG